MSSDGNDPKAAQTLADTMKMESIPFRDKALALEPMPNYSSTPGGPHGMPLNFWASWKLADRPRRIALLMDDCQEEYRPYAEGILPKLMSLVDIFRKKKLESEGVALMWSGWSRTFDDGISNAMDRWYGPRGVRPDEPENACYVVGGGDGMKTLKEIEPTEEEVKDGWFYLGRHLDMFWNFRAEDGKSYLDEKLKSLDIDTVVIAGLWTDECILATAYAASSRGYDVVVVRDAVATATDNGEAALTVCNGTCGNVLMTEEVVSYMKNDFTMGQPGAVKGKKKHPDGRKE